MSTSESRDSGFIGRQPELAILAAALDEALAGRGQMVMLAGEPGIGKTRIAQELAALAEARGARVLGGWCYEHGGAPAYWPWLQCIRAYMETAEPSQLRKDMGPGAADISEIVPELAAKLDGLAPPPALEPEQARFRLFFSITNLLKNVSQSQPVVLVLDDLHWADESSLLLIEFLAREITATPLMVVGIFRDGEITGRHPLSQTLGNLVRERNFRRVQMEGLSQEEVGEFVESRFGVAVPDAAVETLHQRTQGNPLFVGEVVGSVSPEEMALNQDWASAIPEAVRDAILRRLSGLSEGCNRLLRTASVIGREFDLSMLHHPGSEIAEDDIPVSLNEALGIRVIEPLDAGAGRYQFSHALIQQAIYEEIPPIEKAQAHATVAVALENLYQNNLDQHAGELAYQFSGAQTVLGTDKLVHHSLIAGERALETFAYEQAMVHFSRTLAAKEGLAVDSDIAAALFGLGRAQTPTLPRHEMGEAHLNLSRAFDYYASVGDTARVVEITFEIYAPQLSEHGLRTGKMVERALELVPVDSIEAGRLHAFHGTIQGLGDGDYQGARDSLDRALNIARQEGNAALETRALITSAQIEIWNNRFEESLKYSLPAIDLAAAASNFRSEVPARYWACLGSLYMGDTQETQRQASAILESAGRLRDRNWLAAAHDSVARPFTIRGDWQSAREMIQPGLEHMPMDPRILMQRVVVEAQSGERDQTGVYLDRMEELAQKSVSGPNTANGLFACVAPLARYILGAVRQPNMGESSIAAVLSSPTAPPFFSMFARFGASLLAVMDDDIEAAGTHYAALRQSSGMMTCYTLADRVLGLLAGTIGERDDAVTHFESAHAFCSSAGFRPELAWTCHDHAAILLKLGGPEDREKAASLLEECLSIATDLRMTPLMVRAANLQEELGADPGRSPAYPGGLSKREVEVLTHLAQGRTNREIARELVLSERTVQRHISNIYTKINVRNRAEATTFALNRLPS